MFTITITTQLLFFNTNIGYFFRGDLTEEIIFRETPGLFVNVGEKKI